jgi:hypothetical protein
MNASTSNCGPFPDRLAAAIRRSATPVLVGLNPRSEQLPAGLVPGLAIVLLGMPVYFAWKLLNRLRPLRP